MKESKNPVKLVWAQLLVMSGLHTFFTINMDGYKLKFSRSALAVTLFADKHERNEDEDILKKILRPGDTYVDVGSNIGTLVLTAAKAVTPSGKVIAIEAHPATFHNLRENILLNKFHNIEAIHSAAGSKSGSIFFSDTNSDDQNKVVSDQSKGIKVNVNTLDHLLNHIRSIELLKIDVEGYEKYVLEGATQALQKTDVILYESWERHFLGFGYTTGNIITLLFENGFKVYKILGNTIEMLTDSYSSLNCENLLALKDANSFCNRSGYRISQ
ncbi:MAG: FkbM family methyltransferase [Ferruginibacter sp.]